MECFTEVVFAIYFIRFISFSNIALEFITTLEHQEDHGGFRCTECYESPM